MMKRLAPEKNPSNAYRQLWRVVDGAIMDCFLHHPEYIPVGARARVIRNSIVKRVVGALLGYAVQTAQGRSVKKTAAEKTVSSPRVPSDVRCARHAHIGNKVSISQDLPVVDNGGEAP